MKTELCDIRTSILSYRLYGGLSNPLVIVETAMGACSAEWWHLAEKWSEKFCILLYDRAGYGSSSGSTLPRTPDNIAHELNELLNRLGIQKPAILMGHSLGGLLAHRFARLFPDKARALVLLDPVSPNNYRLKENLSKSEYDKSGIDKSTNLKLGLVISSLKLGFLFRPLLRKGPPFFYYKGFSKEAEKSILRNLTQRKLYKASLAEYEFIESEEKTRGLSENALSPNIPLFLICHDPAVMTAEIEKHGRADKAAARKIDEMWISLMKDYLGFSDRATYQQAVNSGHLIHLSNPDILWETLYGIG